MLTDQITIFGAGLAGLIAARMLVDRQVQIFEKQDKLPNNHSAVLRFRTHDVGLATNIPFRKVRVLKDVYSSRGPIADALSYSLKVSGGYFNRSISSLEPSDRYIAPPDLISRLAKTASINYNWDFLKWSDNLIRIHGPVISTIPLPAMMDMFGWKDVPQFSYSPGWTAKAQIKETVPCDVHCTVYFPGSEPFYRASITGRELMVEGTGPRPANHVLQILRAAEALGIENHLPTDYTCKWSAHQKIADVTPAERESIKRFIMWLTEKHGIYSLGRLATWRPKLLLDDIPNDVNVINRLIEGRANYEARIKA